jgi:small subunit ribosomal protein S2
MSGGHLGHKFKDWNSNSLGIKNFSFTRGSFLIFNLSYSIFFIQKAFLFLKQMSRRGSIVMYTDSGKASSVAVKSAAEFASISYINNLWIGGTLTNFRETIYKFLRISFNSVINAKIRRYKSGLSKLDFVPEVVVCSSEFHLPFVINEANSLLLPTVGIVDSNVRLLESTYPVLLNDDSYLTAKSLFFIFSSAYWFGRADFAMRHLSITNSFILFNIFKKFNIDLFLYTHVSTVEVWIKRLKARSRFLPPNVFSLLETLFY